MALTRSLDLPSEPWLPTVEEIYEIDSDRQAMLGLLRERAALERKLQHEHSIDTLKQLVRVDEDLEYHFGITPTV